MLLILLGGSETGWPQSAPPSLGLQEQGPQAAPPPSTPTPPTREENPGLINEMGKLFDKLPSILPPIKSPSETMLKPSIAAAGLDPNDLPARGAIDIGKDIDVAARENRPKRWRDIWSGGHSTSGVTDVPAASDLVARTIAEYREAVGR